MFIRHETIEKNAILLLVLTLITVAIGGIVEIVPLFTIETTVEHVKGVRPYSPLELRGPRHLRPRGLLSLPQPDDPRAARRGRALRPLLLAAESMYDHPFQWGSKRIGPDLARVGGKYSNDWHYAHLKNPQALVPESLMPHYAFLAEHAAATPIDIAGAPAHAPRRGRAVHRRRHRQRAGRSGGAGRSRGRPAALLTALSQGDHGARQRPAPSRRWMRWSPTCRCSARMVDFADTSNEQLQQ